MEQELQEIKQLAINNSKAIQENRDDINKNFANIQNNSIALEILKDYKEEINKLHNEKERQHDTIKRLIRAIIFLCILWAGTIGYLVYVLNDTGVIEETTQEITDFDTINGNVTNRGE